MCWEKTYKKGMRNWDRKDKYKCLICRGNYTSLAKSCPGRKILLNRLKRSQSKIQSNKYRNNRNSQKE